MKNFPMFLRMDGRRVVICGGGTEAARKARLVLKTEAEIAVLATELDPELAGLVASGRAKHLKAVAPDSFTNAALVFVATGCPAHDVAMAALARAAGAVVNVVDRPEMCDALLAPLDMKAMPGAANLDPYFVYADATGPIGVGAMSWFTAMVINPDEVETPASWAEFWDGSKFEASLGLSKNFNSHLLDIIAATFFEGEATFATEDGIMAIIEKAAELKPNVALWWSAESQMEQSMKNGDVIGGQYYLDVANLMALDGFPIKPIFPKEGNPQDYGSWCLSSISEKKDEAAEFISFSSDPATQALMSRKIGTAPLVAKEKTDLTDEEFDFVSGTPSIKPAYEAYLDKETFMKEAWDKMLAGA